MDRSFSARCRAILAKPFFHDMRTLLGLWLLLPVVGAVMKLHSCNNFLIFRGVFWHALNGTSLYAPYPAEHFDTNHYGPLFSLVIAPFAAMPLFVGLLLWLVVLSMFLFWAVRRSTFTRRQQLFVFWFCAHELLTALYMQQFNIAIAAIIVLAYCCIEKEQEHWAAFFIMLGTFVKLYGIVGLAFFFFSRHKGRLVIWLLVWAVVMLVAPMVFHGPDYVLGQYQEWFASLVGKNSENADSIAQNISLLGLVHRVSGYWFNDLWLIVPGLVLFGLPYLRFAQYKHVAFRQTLLASVLMFVVLFSTGSESSGYIIPFVGIVVWYTAAPWKRNGWDVALLVFAFVLSSLSPSDLFPAYVRREWVQPYALKALPVVLIWLKLCYEMLTRDYSSHSHAEEENNFYHTEEEKYYFHTEVQRKKSEIPASFNSAPLCENFHSVTLHKILRSETFGEMVRFAIVGTTAAAIHYAIYWVLQHWINVNVAYTIGYVLSFLVNYYLSAHFTFREHTSARNGVGFGGAHLMNYLLHMVLFNFFLWIGLSRELAPIAVLAIAVPANFLMVRFVFKHFKRK